MPPRLLRLTVFLVRRTESCQFGMRSFSRNRLPSRHLVLPFEVPRQLLGRAKEHFGSCPPQENLERYRVFSSAPQRKSPTNPNQGRRDRGRRAPAGNSSTAPAGKQCREESDCSHLDRSIRPLAAV